MLRLTLIAALVAASPALDPQVQMVDGVSGSLNDYNFSPDGQGKRAVFARSKAGFADAHIYQVEGRGGGWSDPVPIDFTDPRYSDSDPWLTPDGRTLYFVSNRPTSGVEPRKDLDIWRSRRTGHGWGAPEHLTELSSPAPELGIEQHDGRVYFSSARKGGKGGLDIYSAPVLKNAFGKPEPLEGPFNTAGSDSDFTLSANGRTAIFWRSTDGKHASLYRSTREGRGWSEAQPLPASINRGDFNFTPSISRDGRTLWFASTAKREGQPEGMADVYVARLRED